MAINISDILSNANITIPDTTGATNAFQQVIIGLKDIGHGISFFIFWVTQIFGFTPSATIANFIYLGILVYLIKRFLFKTSWIASVAIVAILFLFGAVAY